MLNNSYKLIYLQLINLVATQMQLFNLAICIFFFSLLLAS